LQPPKELIREKTIEEVKEEDEPSERAAPEPEIPKSEKSMPYITRNVSNTSQLLTLSS